MQHLYHGASLLHQSYVRIWRQISHVSYAEGSKINEPGENPGIKQHETSLAYYSVGTANDGLFLTIWPQPQLRICQLMLDNSKHTKAIKPMIW